MRAAEEANQANLVAFQQEASKLQAALQWERRRGNAEVGTLDGWGEGCGKLGQGVVSWRWQILDSFW